MEVHLETVWVIIHKTIIKIRYSLHFIESIHLKYGIYNPREFKDPIKKHVQAHSFLYGILNSLGL